MNENVEVEVGDCWSDADEDALLALDIAFDSPSVDTQFQGCHSKNTSELSSSKFSLECDKILEELGTPRQRYRPKYLTVSDLASQHWCEQKLLYNFSLEVYLLRAEPGVEIKVGEDVETKVAKGKGSDIHLSRELEIQVPVEVPVQTNEDRWAVKFHNLQAAILGFLQGQKIAREIPMFGCPFDSEIFVFGIVDEICYDPSSHTLQISELKTRRSLYLPQKSHQEKDKFQLGIYRQLFDDLVLGKVSKKMIQDHLGIDLTKPLSKEVADVLMPSDDLKEEQVTLNSILDTLLSQIQSLTCIESGRVEYVHQDTKSRIAYVDLDKDPEEVRNYFEHLSQWWKGDRGTRGVDVEDCWKCGFCEFSPLCEWRDVMAQKTSKSWKKKS